MAPRFRLARTRLETAQPAIRPVDIPFELLSPARAERAKLYGSKDWSRLRYQHFKEHPTCRVCRKKASAVDHLTGHEDRQAGDVLAQLGLLDRIPADWRSGFWTGPFISLSHACHNKKTAMESKEKLVEWVD